ncbi:MAG: DUF2269 domain-containing protein [Gammaproteobacteria bacterium]|nr:DUF2269 domain-containing protein [Gammaproteobacteria bacterium]MDH5303237.1 DUF2269 domain-containing protein [Gammaproteobacteria bacterium]MDH5322551.1 DUF2269 domain-containing protein [Gammaproteobacteria bacterium]
MSYLILKMLHVASVVIFLGNITTGLFWANHAHKSREFKLIASTFDGIIRSDRRFTTPGVLGILITGLVAAAVAGLPLLSTGWIFWPIVLFSISGLVFAVWVAPLQRKILQLARSTDSTEAAWQRYMELYKRWELWGLVALITPVAAMVIMVLKPALPGL